MTNTKLVVMMLIAFILGGCASLKLSRHPEAINICPSFSENEDSAIVYAYKAELALEKRKDSVFIKSVTCDSIAYPPLNLYYDRTRIAGNDERIKAVAFSAIGIGLPIALIASGTPFFVFWMVNPMNQMYLTVDLADSLESKNKKPVYNIMTSAWTGNRESQIERQSERSREAISRIIKKVKGKKGASP